jgi:hypothetical protein
LTKFWRHASRVAAGEQRPSSTRSGEAISRSWFAHR